jgi:hypothetical protein
LSVVPHPKSSDGGIENAASVGYQEIALSRGRI